MEETIQLARELANMTSSQQRQAVQAKRQQPKRTMEELVHEATTGRSRQIIVTLSPAEHRALQTYARGQKMTQDEAAARLITAGLTELKALDSVVGL
jgi:hypothetical protein